MNHRNPRCLFAALLLCVGLFACASPHANGRVAEATPAGVVAPDVLEFLLDAAAGDFSLAGADRPAGIRAARVGQLAADEGSPLYLLCGEFQPGGKAAKDGWVPFATLKTEGYEQWLGGQAVPLCEQAGIRWDEGDQSEPLLERIKRHP